MNRVIPFVIALLAVGAFAGFSVWSQWDNHIEVQGAILKVRTFASSPRSVVVFLECRITNPAAVPFQVDEAELGATLASAEPVTGSILAAIDAIRLLDSQPEIGGRFNDPLKMRDVIGPKMTVDRMLAFQFLEVSEEAFTRRKALVLRLGERNGSAHELREAR